MLRQIFCFVFASALLGGGLYMLYDEVFIAHVLMARLIVIALFFTILGGYWLWLDFGEPLWKRLTNSAS